MCVVSCESKREKTIKVFGCGGFDKKKTNKVKIRMKKRYRTDEKRERSVSTRK